MASNGYLRTVRVGGFDKLVFEICLFEPNGELQISEARF